MAKQKIYGMTLDFFRKNIVGGIIGGGLGALFAFFQPLFIITVLIFSYFTPLGLDWNASWFKFALVIAGALVGMIINSFMHRR